MSVYTLHKYDQYQRKLLNYSRFVSGSVASVCAYIDALLAHRHRGGHIPAQAWITFDQINHHGIDDIALAIAAKLIDATNDTG